MNCLVLIRFSQSEKAPGTVSSMIMFVNQDRLPSNYLKSAPADCFSCSGYTHTECIPPPLLFPSQITYIVR